MHQIKISVYAEGKHFNLKKKNKRRDLCQTGVPSKLVLVLKGNNL